MVIKTAIQLYDIVVLIKDLRIAEEPTDIVYPVGTPATVVDIHNSCVMLELPGGYVADCDVDFIEFYQR